MFFQALRRAEIGVQMPVEGQLVAGEGEGLGVREAIHPAET